MYPSLREKEAQLFSNIPCGKNFRHSRYAFVVLSVTWFWFRMFEWSSYCSKSSFARAMMMTACDLNGTTKPWEIQKEVRSVFFPWKNSLRSNIVNDSIAYPVLPSLHRWFLKRTDVDNAEATKNVDLSAKFSRSSYFIVLITSVNFWEIQPSLSSLGSIFLACERLMA